MPRGGAGLCRRWALPPPGSPRPLPVLGVTPAETPPGPFRLARGAGRTRRRTRGHRRTWLCAHKPHSAALLCPSAPARSGWAPRQGFQAGCVRSSTRPRRYVCRYKTPARLPWQQATNCRVLETSQHPDGEQPCESSMVWFLRWRNTF